MTAEAKLFRLAHWIACFVIAAVLLSGYAKILNPADFAVAVYRYRLLPGYLVNPAAIYLPWLELVCAGCLLFFPRLRTAALWIVLGLLILFTGAVGINVWRGSVFGCGCSGRGAAEEPLGWVHLARNLGLIGLVVLARLARKRMEVCALSEPGGDEAPPSSPAN